MMLGTMRLVHGMYGGNEPSLAPDKRELSVALNEAVTRLPQDIYQVTATTGSPIVAQQQAVPAPEFLKPDAYCVHPDGRLCINDNGTLQPLDDLPAETRSRIRRLIDLRDRVRTCLRSQIDGSNDEQVADARFQLNLVYDRFVARFGPVNLPANQRAFHGDPDLPLLLSLENYNDETRVATKAAIFRERTIHYKQAIESAGTPKEALLVTLNEKGRVDLERMSGLLNRPVDEIIPDL